MDWGVYEAAIMFQLCGLANEQDPNSLSNRLRTRRFKAFEGLVSGMPHPLRILDLGGTNIFWERRGWAGRPDVHITMLNIEPEPCTHENIEVVCGDGCDLSQFDDGSYDIVFSNSVIEHVFTYQKQEAMAREIRRVARAYWVQTPNFWFPIEPHFHVPGWQWLPQAVRVAMLRRWRCGWRGPCPDPDEARRLVQEVRLLTRGALRRLFPEATIKAERFCGMVKSWIAVYGFEPLPGNGQERRSMPAESLTATGMRRVHRARGSQHGSRHPV